MGQRMKTNLIRIAVCAFIWGILSNLMGYPIFDKDSIIIGKNLLINTLGSILIYIALVKYED
jgi:hypothetical protein